MTTKSFVYNPNNLCGFFYLIETMGTNKKPVQLKVFIDKQKKKVIFAEADEDFVDVLFSFLTLPLGTIARLSLKHGDSKDIKIGSLTSLYESVVNLNTKHFSEQSNKDILIYPKNSSSYTCRWLKVNLDHEAKDEYDVRYFGIFDDRESAAVFLKNMGNFIITDNLNVVPVMLDTSIVLLNSLGVENINLLEERTMCFGLEEFLDLLRWSLLTNNPLTNLVFGGDKTCSSSCITNSTSTNAALPSSNCGKTVKFLVQKSNGKLLCAQVEKFFVEMLFSFLTIPLGRFIRLTKDSSPPSGIINLYNSISSLGDENNLKYEKTQLLCPNLDGHYFRVTDLLPIYKDNARKGSFLKGQSTFIVSNNLEVKASLSVATISNFNTIGIPVADMEVQEVSIGEHEALLLLKASLTSTSALTDCFSAFLKKPQVKSST
ncbi:hypothetical protein LXL04_036195 [Taraxacum kok-saghyz]